MKNCFLWIIFITLIISCIYFFGSILIPFFFSFIVAYFANPLCFALEKYQIPRHVSAAGVSCVFFLIIITFFWLIVPFFVIHINSFLLKVPSYLQRLNTLIFFLQHKLSLYGFDAENIMWVNNSVNRALTSGVRSILSAILWTRDSITTMISIVMIIFLTPFLTFYVLRDFHIFLEKILSMIPLPYQKIVIQTVLSIDMVLNAFIRGQFIVCMVMSFYYMISFLFLRLDFSVLLGLGIGFLIFIPYLGILTGSIVVFAVACSQFHNAFPFLFLIGVFLVGQVIEGYIITPRLVGGRIGLHPVVMIFSFLAGVRLLGIFGVLIAIPVAAILGVIARVLFRCYLQSSFYQKLS